MRRGTKTAVARELTGAKMPSSQEMRKFIKYFRQFYDADGLYPMCNLEDKDIIKGVKIRLQKHPDMPFDGDSADREIVRDIVLGWKKMAKELTAYKYNFGSYVDIIRVLEDMKKDSLNDVKEAKNANHPSLRTYEDFLADLNSLIKKARIIHSKMRSQTW